MATKTQEATQDNPSQTPTNPAKNTTPVETIHQSESQDLEKDSLETEQVVVFKLANEEYAAPILSVQEIMPTSDITPFPNVSPYISGIINVRGTVATVINLAKRFSLTREAADNIDRYIILTPVDNALFGITVDDVTSVMKIPKNKIKSADNGLENKPQSQYIDNIALVDDRIILILDFQKIVGEEAVTVAKEATTPPKT